MSADPQPASTMAPLLDGITSVPATIPRAELIFVPGGAEKVLNSIRERARKEAAGLDVSRPKDREAMRSLAYKLRRLKTTGDESGKELKEQYQSKILPIDAERRVFRSEMDDLIAEIIAPAEAFDAAEETRIREHETAVADLVWPKFNDDMGPSSAEATALIDALDHMHVTRQWQEFADRAAHTRTSSRNALLVAKMNAEAREKAEAEALRLAEQAAEAARQEAARLQAEREAEIARQAAETARVAAETAAREEAARVAAAEAAERARIEQRAREAAAKAEQERLAAEAETRAAVEREAEAERRRIEAERRIEDERIGAHKAAITAIPENEGYGKTESSGELARRGRYLVSLRERDWQEFAAEASAVLEAEIERTRGLLAAAQARETEALQAEHAGNMKREADAAAAALEAERQRVEGERIKAEAILRQQEEAARKVSENKAHQRQVNRNALDDLIHITGLHEPEAKQVLEAIIKEQIRHVRITY